MKPVFPFSAVVGNEDLKLALILAALDPKIAGVLIEGEKGTAKTTLARGLGTLLPHPGKFVELPLGVTEDRVKGALDLAQLVKDQSAVLRQGLLGEANGGVLYVDEVNLLADHIVDMVLDAAATGENKIERDSISLSEPSNFVLIGSMNSEEGWLRPQLLDRFGLFVRASAIGETQSRVEATKRRLEFDADPDGFAGAYTQSEAAIAQKIVDARIQKSKSRFGLLAEMTPESWEAISKKIEEMHSGSLRADLVLVRGACAYAFWVGDEAVSQVHVEAVAPFVFAHRSQDQGAPPRPPAPSPPSAPSTHSQGRSQDSQPQDSPAQSPDGEAQQRSNSGGGGASGAAEKDFDPQSFGGLPEASRFEGMRKSDRPIPRDRIDHVIPSRRGNPGVANFTSGASVSSEPVGTTGYGSIDALATLRHGITRTFSKSGEGASREVVIDYEDFYRSLRYEYQARLVVVALDTSGSMGLEKRIALAREVLVGILDDSHKRRNKVSLVTFGGQDAKLALSNARSVELLQRKLSQLNSGGLSPLGAGLSVALATALGAKESGMRAEILVITDGRATSGEGDAIQDASRAAKSIASAGIDVTFIDLEVEHPRLNYCQKFADLARGRVVKVVQ